MSKFIDIFAGLSIGMIAVQLLFSLLGVPYDGRFLPLRMAVMSRGDAASGGTLLLLQFYSDANALSVDFVHLGSLLPDPLHARNLWSG
jgi:hypothetical protein